MLVELQGAARTQAPYVYGARRSATDDQLMLARHGQGGGPLLMPFEAVGPLERQAGFGIPDVDALATRGRGEPSVASKRQGADGSFVLWKHRFDSRSFEVDHRDAAICMTDAEPSLVRGKFHGRDFDAARRKGGDSAVVEIPLEHDAIETRGDGRSTSAVDHEVMDLVGV